MEGKKFDSKQFKEDFKNGLIREGALVKLILTKEAYEKLGIEFSSGHLVNPNQNGGIELSGNYPPVRPFFVVEYNIIDRYVTYDIPEKKPKQAIPLE
ncbi:MAG: hypothetical protein PHD81_04165 [Candidatus Nanoarchaeia archaeon]|nr:hypothetical protein [Candidatus Nanoarchaeia archaeon]MDD5588277.1 hypothetical protein [Candidatus Nanoarchaeia archaeon]